MPLNPLPPDPEPTEADLARHWPDLRGITDRQARWFAKTRWKTVEQEKNPDAFLVHFFNDGGYVASLERHKLYLETPLWRAIRARRLVKAGRKCACCSSEATQVHHRDYRPRVLAGQDDSPLVALCEVCHIQKVHGKGERLAEDRTWDEAERVLDKLVAKEDARLALAAG